jgi:hypothetical protein
MKKIKKFDGFSKIEEHQEHQNYMFFGNLKTIKRLVDEMLEMDEATIDQMLSNGHDWAGDHIATSKDDIEEVFNFLAGHNEPEEDHGYATHDGSFDGDDSEQEQEEDPYSQLMGGPESSHTEHDARMRSFNDFDKK